MDPRHEVYIRSLPKDKIIQILKKGKYAELSNTINEFNINGNDLLDMREYNVILKLGKSTEHKILQSFQELLNVVQATPEVLFPLKPKIGRKPTFITRPKSDQTQEESASMIKSELSTIFSQHMTRSLDSTIPHRSKMVEVVQNVKPTLFARESFSVQSAEVKRKIFADKSKVFSVNSSNCVDMVPKENEFVESESSEKTDSVEITSKIDDIVSKTVAIAEIKDIPILIEKTFVESKSSNSDNNVEESEDYYKTPVSLSEDSNSDKPEYLDMNQSQNNDILPPPLPERNNSTKNKIIKTIDYNELPKSQDDLPKYDGSPTAPRCVHCAKHVYDTNSMLDTQNITSDQIDSKIASKTETKATRRINSISKFNKTAILSSFKKIREFIPNFYREQQNEFKDQDIQEPTLEIEKVEEYEDSNSDSIYYEIPNNDKSNIINPPPLPERPIFLSDKIEAENICHHEDTTTPECRFHCHKFYKNISRSEGIRILESKRVGTFLFRPCETQHDEYLGILMLHGVEAVLNFPVCYEKHTEQFYLASAMKFVTVRFESLDVMLDYYSFNYLRPGDKLVKSQVNYLD